MPAWLRSNACSIAAFIWGVAEATLFFFVPDVLISFVGLRRGAKAGLIASLAAAIGASIGGVIMYVWSVHDPAGAERTVLAIPAISESMAAAARQAMETQGWFAASLEGPLSRTPYKVFAIYAPHVGAALAPFALASIAARLPRFLLSAFAAALARRWLGRGWSETTLTWVLIAFWVLFYAAFFALTPN